MSSDQLRGNDKGPDRRPDLGLLLAAAPISEAALRAFYLATAPRLAYALSATRDERLADQVLVRTYRRVWSHPRPGLTALTGDEAVFGWLMRIALVELASLRRDASISTTGRLAPGTPR